MKPDYKLHLVLVYILCILLALLEPAGDKLLQNWTHF